MYTALILKQQKQAIFPMANENDSQLIFLKFINSQLLAGKRSIKNFNQNEVEATTCRWHESNTLIWNLGNNSYS